MSAFKTQASAPAGVYEHSSHKAQGTEAFVPGVCLLQEPISLPAAVVYQSRLNNNLGWMQQFANSRGVALAPHGKTTMTPDFFKRQRDAGAWAITLATVAQVAAAFNAGIERVVMANQLVGRANMARVSQLLAAGNRDFYCLVDSVANIEQLQSFFAERGQKLKVLIEIGVSGARTGARTNAEVQALCKALATCDALQLAGVETYEGVINGDNMQERIRDHLVRVRDTCFTLLQENRFDTEQVILTGAGSAWYDLVSEIFTDIKHPRVLPVIRPGCYLIHDQGIYLEAQNNLRQRMGDSCTLEGDLTSALEVWAYVQSIPEPGLAILTLGKRDAAFDAGLPQPALHYRPGSSAPRQAPGNWTVYHIMDQHSAMQVPADADIAVGDMIALSTSHPCLTFDKWRSVYVMDDNYNLLEHLQTCF